MRILTLKQFIQQAGAPQEVLAMPVREFLNEIATQCEDNCTALVTLDSLEPNSTPVKFLLPGVEKAEPCAPTEGQHGNQVSTFELSVVRIGDELPDLSDYATVQVTLDKNDPTKIMLRFRGNEDSGD